MSCREYVPPTAVAGRRRHASRACQRNVWHNSLVLKRAPRPHRRKGAAIEMSLARDGLASPVWYHRAYVFART